MNEDETNWSIPTEPPEQDEPGQEVIRPVDVAKMVVLCPAAFFAAFYVVETLKVWFFY